MKIKEHIFDKFYPDIDFSGFEAKMKMLVKFYSTANVFCKVFECGHWHLIHYEIRPIVAAWMIKDNAHTELKDAGGKVVVTAEDLQLNGHIGWSWINNNDGYLSSNAEKGSLQELAFAFLGIVRGSSICKFVQHLATHDEPASLMTIFSHKGQSKVHQFAAMHVEQGHIKRTKKSRSFFYAMSASAREFCEEQLKNPSAGTIKRRQAFGASRQEHAKKKQKVAK